MPLTYEGMKVLKKFKKEYGSKGVAVFYAWSKMHPSIAKNFHK